MLTPHHRPRIVADFVVWRWHSNLNLDQNGSFRCLCAANYTNILITINIHGYNLEDKW